MNKNEVVLEILNAYDELEKLRAEKTSRQTDALSNVIVREKIEGSDPLTDYFIEIGMDALINEVVWYSRGIQVSTTEDGEEVIETFKKWVERIINKNKFPSHLSVQSVLDFMEPKLRKIYEKQVALYKQEKK